MLDVYLLQHDQPGARLDLKKLMNYLLNDIFICFLLVLAGSYLKATLGIEFIRLFNLM